MKCTTIPTMNQIDYTLIVRRWAVSILIVSTGILAYVLSSLDPYADMLFVWIFILTLGIWLASGICSLAIWFYFTHRKKILTITQTNNLLYQSLISSATIVLLFGLSVTGFLNLFSFLIVLLCYVLYQLYTNSYSHK